QLELVQEHLRGVLGGHRTEADLRQATLHRGLAAFEAGLDLALAGAGEGALVTATRGLAQAGADSATDAGTLLAGALCGLESIQTHGILLSPQPAPGSAA